MSAIIKVENVSKRFVLNHEGQERYTALRDVLTRKAASLLKGGGGGKASKEEFWALKDISFDIEQGDRVGIVGRNGAGKSTLLKILSRITEPSTGRITIAGRVASLLEVGTGFHPELTGRENIFLNGAILGMSRSEIRRKFDEIVDFAEVARFLDTPVKRYSSGMYVRLAFAVAAHLEPEILIVDEVLAVGDAQFQKKCLGKMEDVSKNQGRTVLFVSHNMGVVANLCNRGILLNKGTIEFQGNVTEVVNRYVSNAGSSDNIGYIADEKVKSKHNYFNKIELLNSSLEPSADFSFSEEIVLRFEFRLDQAASSTLVGIGIQDKFQNRVSTFVKPANDFSKGPDGLFRGLVKLPAGVIAPNLYSFVFALWAKDIDVYHQLENICAVKIHDSGSSHAQFEGFDYGSVILNPKWENA